MMREKGGGGELESPVGGLQPMRTPSADYYALSAGWQSHPSSSGRLDLEALPSRMLAGIPPPLTKSPFSAATPFGRHAVLSPDRPYPSGMESALDRDSASSLYNRAYRGSADLFYGGEQPPPPPPPPPLSVPTYHSSKDSGYLGLACPPESNGGALYSRSVLENSLFNRGLSMASLPTNHPNLVSSYRSHLASSAGEDFSMERPLDRKFVFGANHASSSLLPYNRLLENYSAHPGEPMSEAVKSNLESSVGERTGSHYGSPLPTHMAFSTGTSYISRNPPLYPFAHLSSSFTPESYTSYTSSLTHLSTYGQLSAAPPPAHSRAHDAFAQRAAFAEEESKSMEGSVGQPFDATMSRDFTTAPAPQWDHATVAASEPKRESTMGSYNGQTQRSDPSVTDAPCNCFEDTQALPLPKEEDALEQLMGSQFVAVGSQEKMLSVQSKSCDQTSSQQNPCQIDTNSWNMTDSRYAAHSMAALASANSAHSSPVMDISTNEQSVHQPHQASYSVNSSRSTATTFLPCSEPAVFPARYTSTASATSCSYTPSRNSGTVCQAPKPSCLYSGTDDSEVDSGLEPKLQQQSRQIPGKDNRFVSIGANTGQLNEKRFPYVLIARTTEKDISAYTSAKTPRKDPPQYDSSTSEYEPPSPSQQSVKSQKRGRKPGVTVKRRTITTSFQEDSDDTHDDTYSSKIKVTMKTERVTTASTENVPKCKTNAFKKRQKKKGTTQSKVKAEGGKRNNRTCPLCLKTFSRADSLTCHMRVHTGDRPYQCDQCAASYKVSSHLRDHIRSKHSGAKPFQCEKCSKPFTYSTARRRHEKICGKDLAERVEYQCSSCNKGFVTAKGFSKHQEKCGIVQSDGTLKGERVTYKCKNCRKVFDSLPSLDGHQRFFCGKTKNLQTGHFLCTDCGKAFFKRNPYIVHMRHHAGGKPFRCVQCEGRFNGKDALKRHMERHKRNSKFQCPSCDASFFVKRCLSLHVMRVHGRLKEYKCNECEWDFSCGYHLCRHRRIVHRHVKQFKYVLVGKDFTGASFGIKHKRRHLFQPYGSRRGRQIIRRQTCKLCNKSFSMEKMRFHISSAHPGVTLSEALSKPLARCKLCCRDFSCKETLHVHRLRHRDKKQFRCHHCDTMFLLKSVLRLHRQRQHADHQPHSCPECEETFRWQASLRQHMIMHHSHRTQNNGEPDISRFMCNVCGKRFEQQASLNVHIKMHCAAVPHICSQCGKGFVDLKHLKLHMSRHDHDSSPKSFVCEKCGEAFISHQLLQDHLRKRHTEQPKRAWLCDECGQSLCRRDSLQKHMALHVKYRNGLIPRGPQKGVKRPKRSEVDKSNVVQGFPSPGPPDPERKTISSRFSDFANAYGISEADLVDLKPANFAPPDLGTSPSLGVIPNFGATSRFGPTTTPGFVTAPPDVAQQPLTTQEQFNYQYHHYI